MIELKTETYFEVNYQHLNDLLNETYKLKNFNIADKCESRNGSYLKFNVKSYSYHDCENFDEVINKLRRDEYVEDIRGVIEILLKDLCFKKIIEPGKYIVTIFW